MAEPYWRRGAAVAAAVVPPLFSNTGSSPKPSFPGLPRSEFSTFTNHNPSSSNAMLGSSDLQQTETNGQGLKRKRKRKKTVKGKNICNRCGNEGHFVKDCTQNQNEKVEDQSNQSKGNVGVTTFTQAQLVTPEDPNTLGKKCESKHDGECFKEKNVFPCGSDERLINNCTQNKKEMVENQPKGNVGAFALTPQGPKEEPNSMAAGHLPKPSSPRQRSSEFSTLTNHNPFMSNDLPSCPSDFLQKDILTSLPAPLGVYRGDDIAGEGPAPSLARGTAGASISGYPTSFGYPNLHGYQHNVASGIGLGISDMTYDRLNSTRTTEGVSVLSRDSNILFVDGLPTDCSRREIGHLFRPFLGFVDLRLVHKERRCQGDKAKALCFVEFANMKCARTAKDALQGYKFDDKKPHSPVLDIHFVHFPFRLP